MPPSQLSLKQGLAKLSNSQALSASIFQFLSVADKPESDSGMKQRARTFNPPWKRQHQELGSEQSSAMDELHDVMSRMIFQAGVDFETRPMVILNASALPDPQVVSYDDLLSCILALLDLYVEADYTVVFFAAGGRYTPGWNWVWKAYRNLSRKYRKNLKQLYIVHSSLFTKMLFSFAGAIISPKFFQKLVYVNTLSELAARVPLTQIDIPPAVYKENLKFERHITLSTPVRSNVFGVSLEDIMGYNGTKGDVPKVVRDTIQYLRASGLEEEGLFRRSPSSSVLRTVQDAYDRGNVVSLRMFGDPHLAAVLLKKYLRDLPEPIFPEKLYSLIWQCPPPSTDAAANPSSVQYIRETLLPALLPCAYILLNSVLHLLHDCASRSHSNRMDAHNLALVLSPNLIQGTSASLDVQMCSILNSPLSGRTTLCSVLRLCIERYHEVFDQVPEHAEAVAAMPNRTMPERHRKEGAVSHISSVGSAPTLVLQNDDDDEQDDTRGGGDCEGLGEPEQRLAKQQDLKVSPRR